MRASNRTFSRSLKRVFKCSFFFAILGPLIGAIVVVILYGLALIFGNARGTLSELGSGIGVIILLGYLIGVMPAALTGLFSGWVYTLNREESSNNVKYLNVFITSVFGVVVSGAAFWVWDIGFARPWLVIAIGGVSSAICSLIFFKRYV